MRYLFFSLLMSVLMSSLAAQAKKSIPVLNWQAPGGILSLTTSYVYDSVDVEDLSSGGQTRTEKGAGQALEFEAEYGLLSFFSLGGSFRYSKLTVDETQLGTTTEITTEGPNDLEGFVKMILPLTKTILFLGTAYAISTESRKFRNGLDRFNAMSGGNSLTPFASIQFPMGPFWVGMRGEWRLFDPRDNKVDGILTTKLSGGDELDVVANFEYSAGGTAFGLGGGVFLKQAETSTNVATGVDTVTESFSKVHALVYTRLSYSRFQLILRGDYFEAADLDLGSGLTRVSSKEIEGTASLRVLF